MSDGQPVRLTGWGRSSTSRAVVHRDVAPEALAGLIAGAGGRGVLARGLGRSYGDAALNAGGDVVAPISRGTTLDLDTAAGTVRAPAGTSIDELLRRLLPAGWCLPVLPGTRFVSVGGAIAADVHGKNHHADGSFGRWVRELTLVDGLGETRTLTRHERDEQFWATVGGMGLTGIVTSAVLDLLPVTSASMSVRSRRLPNLDDTFDAMLQSRARYHVAWVDACPGPGFGRSVLDEAEHPDDDGAGTAHRPPVPVPAPRLPANVVRPAVIRLFNEAWWRRAPQDRTTTVPLTRYFHPLDGLGDWHRLYGPRGLLQWQVAVPFTGRPVIEASLRAFGAAGCVPALVVLKRFGAGSQGGLSFPVPGWTLAVDVPASYPGLHRLLTTLDEQVAAAGGRVYLAKDARLDAGMLTSMYPRLDGWRAVRDRLDPRRVFQSDLARRLGLL